ncbi:MAG: DUF4058 family protein [Caldilineaceae bacterium]|nr:DUF4058 family protein [Caldilineaceae bacterium]
MRCPFPGMDPYLEHPSLWPDVHNRLIAAIADVLVPQVAPRYYVALERRAYLLSPDDVVFVGRPDIALVPTDGSKWQSIPVAVAEGSAIYAVEVPMADEVDENYLEIREVKTGKLVTILELLSPTNKLHEEGRCQYTEKRATVLRSRTSLVEIDLLRAGEPMTVVGPDVRSDYRVLISPGWRRPHAQMYAFSLRDPIPEFPIPLLPKEDPPTLPLNDVIHDLYTRARFDLRIDYAQQPIPPLTEDAIQWARPLLDAMIGAP